MNLKTFFAMRNVPDEATCVSVGTDGFSTEKNNIMSVSVKAPGEPAETIYISGAQAAKVEKITGVSPDYYAERAVGIMRAEEILREKVKTDLLVSYTVGRFSRPWLFTAFPQIFRPGAHMWFDTLAYIAYGDSGNPFPVDAPTPEDVFRVVNDERGIRFDEAVSTRLPLRGEEDTKELSVLEGRIHHLHKLWVYCLDREL